LAANLSPFRVLKENALSDTIVRAIFPGRETVGNDGTTKGREDEKYEFSAETNR
jgi:hypothetical protein